MRRGFGRRRRRSEEGRRAPIDPVWIERVREAGWLGGASLERVEWDDVPAHVALTARATDAEGVAWAVGVAPASGGDALLAALVTAARAEQDSPRVLAVCERIDTAARERLARVSGPGEPQLRELGGGAAPAERPALSIQPLDQLAQQLTRPADRALYSRVLAALVGLAAKHGGAVRAAGNNAELVVLTRRVAVLRIESEGVVLESFTPRRNLERVGDPGLSECMDRLEGFVRKRLNERGVRDGEEGLRGLALGAVEAAAGLRFAARWPLGGSDRDALDLAGVAQDGTPVVVAVRERLTLEGLGEILDATVRLEPWLPIVLQGADAPVRWGTPRLMLVARDFDAVIDAVAGSLTVPIACFELGEREGRVVLSARETVPAAPRTPRPAAAVVASDVAPPKPEVEETARAEDASADAPRTGDAGEVAARAGDPGEGAPRAGGASEEHREGSGEGRARRSRGGRGRGRRRTQSAAAEPGEEPSFESAEKPRFEELSFFDLEGDSDEEPGDGAGRRRRGRRRGRGRGGRGAEAEASSESATGETPEAEKSERGREERSRAGRSRTRGGRRSSKGTAAVDRDAESEADDLDDGIPELSPEAPEFEVAAVPDYDDDEEVDEPESEADRIRLEREKRRLARLAKSGPEPESDEAESQEAQSLPRGRAAILAHADRESILAAVLLAREWRQVEGIWIYPQTDLMTFFRGVAIDLRENMPIFVVGFSASPARDAIQAAALYRDRLAWFDHHEWPPEDRGAMAEAIGADHLHVEAGTGSVLPAVVSFCTRRSRFSDKLVDLVTARFTEHDFQRWGRLWWHRLGELATKTGENRSAVESLLTGRPSDLAREAARADQPAVPDELAFARSRDFRLVHFGGLVLVVVETPPDIDGHLAARIVRERYAAAISLARREGDDLCVLGADDASNRKAMDVSGMVQHLDEKFAWVEAQSDADHVARFRIRGLAEKPERLDEVLSEVGMGRSILEG